MEKLRCRAIASRVPQQYVSFPLAPPDALLHPRRTIRLGCRKTVPHSNRAPCAWLIMGDGCRVLHPVPVGY